MKKSIFTLIMLGFVTAIQAQPLLQDASVRKGTLANGLTYYVRHNAKDPGLAEFYIAQRVGSILEEPRQRGLAHFLEHMAFNGTENFPGAEKGGLREWCESKGIKFGANLNAYTSVDQTVYNISSAPVSKAGVVDTCLLILHDWSHYLLLKDDEIDKERGVIHEEWRTRRAGMAGQRMIEDALPTVYKGTKYEDCLPIGSMEIVDKFPYQDLRDYYQKWYRPDLQAIIVVGDVDVDEMEQKIRSAFGSIPMPENPAERIYYPVSDNEKMIVFTELDNEQPTVNFSLYMKRDITPRDQRNTTEYYADGYKSTLVTTILRERLKKLTDCEKPALMNSNVRDGQFYISSTKDAFSLTCGLIQDSIKEGITAAVATVEQARQHGFTEAELQRAKAERQKVYETRFAQREKTRNSHYVSQCLRNFLENEPIISAEEELSMVKRLNESITLGEVNATLREMVTDRNQVVTIFGPAKNGFQLPANEEIEQTILTAQQKTYAAPSEEKVPEKLITRLPKKGKIKKESPSTNGYREYVLSNGMRVYARSTDFDGDNITMNMFSLGGNSLYPDADMASLNYLAAVVGESGVAGFDNATLSKMLAGKTASVKPFVNSQTEGMNGKCTRPWLKTMLELTYLYFAQPRFDKQAFASLMNRQEAFLTNREANPNVSYNDSVRAILYGNHPRMAPMKKNRLKEVSFDRICQIYKERFADASDFCVILTGNFDERELRELLCQYLASLPSKYVREEVVDRHIDVRPVDEVHTFRKHQATPSALTNIYFTAPIAYTAENDLKLDVLAQIMRMVYTEKVREEKGGTYGVSVQGEMQKFPADEALLRINFRTDPEKYEELIPIIYEQLDSMAANGPKAEDLQKVKEYEIKTYGQAAVMNGYWDYVKYNELRNGVDFDKDYCKLVESLTQEAIRQFCQQLLAPKHRIQVTMLPE